MIIRISFFPKQYPVYISYHKIKKEEYDLLLYIFNEITLDNFISNEQFSNGNSDIDIIEDEEIIEKYLDNYGSYQFNLLGHIFSIYGNQLDHNNDKLLETRTVKCYSDTEESSELKTLEAIKIK